VICAKTAEPVEVQFGMLTLVGPGTYMECRCPTGMGSFGMSGLL